MHRSDVQRDLGHSWLSLAELRVYVYISESYGVVVEEIGKSILTHNEEV